MSDILAHLDGPVTWKIAASVLVALFFGLVLWGIVAEVANPDREDDR